VHLPNLRETFPRKAERFLVSLPLTLRSLREIFFTQTQVFLISLPLTLRSLRALREKFLLRRKGFYFFSACICDICEKHFHAKVANKPQRKGRQDFISAFQLNLNRNLREKHPEISA
jgi:hypothetical protein